jgi:hypothetical protein
MASPCHSFGGFMAFWIEDDFSDDVNGIFYERAINAEAPVRYGADSLSDIATLPAYNGKNQGSSVMVLEDGSFHKLGTIPSRGINGWVRI